MNLPRLHRTSETLIHGRLICRLKKSRSRSRATSILFTRTKNRALLSDTSF